MGDHELGGSTTSQIDEYERSAATAIPGANGDVPNSEPPWWETPIDEYRSSVRVDPAIFGLSDEDEHAVDTATATPSSRVPFLDELQASFGPEHNLDNINSHTNDAASAVADRLGAKAFASGPHVVFGSAPDLWTTAHEVTHVVQQRGGVQPHNGIGLAGDAHEQQANAVADAVVSGQTAQSLLAGLSDAPAAGAGSVVQLDRKTVVSANQHLLDLSDKLEEALNRAETALTSKASSEEALGALIEEIEITRSQVSSATLAVGDGDPAKLRAWKMIDRTKAVLPRLHSIVRGVRARKATVPEVGGGNREEALERAAEKFPGGYCDVPGTAQGESPCDLDPQTRQRYRDSVRDVVHVAHSNWNTAVVNVNLAEKLRANDIRFEEQLAGLLLEPLFGLLASGAASLGAKAIGKLEKAMTVEGGVYPGVVDSPDKETVDHAKEAVGIGAKHGATKLQKQVGISARELNQRARPSVPTDREAFLNSLSAVPTQWVSNILKNLDQLLDADLAGLASGLPDVATITPKFFEGRILDTLDRFHTQVEGLGVGMIGGSRRAVMVIMPRGPMRTALAQEETVTDNDLKGESKGSPARTGKWRFIQWIDNDMSSMAVSRTQEDVAPGDMFKTPFDASFWSIDSLPTLIAAASGPLKTDSPKSPLQDEGSND